MDKDITNSTLLKVLNQFPYETFCSMVKETDVNCKTFLNQLKEREARADARTQLGTPMMIFGKTLRSYDGVRNQVYG